MAYLNGIEQLFGMTLTLGGEGSIIGAPVLSEDPPSSLSVTTFDITYGYNTVVRAVIAGIAPLWDWDSTGVDDLYWGNMRLYRYNEKLYYANGYTGGDFGSISPGTGTVTVVKSSKSMMVIIPMTAANRYSVITVGTMKGADGTEYKAVTTQVPESSYVTIRGSLDDTENEALVTWNTSNNTRYITGVQADVLIPFYIDTASVVAVWEDLYITMGCVDLYKHDLYAVGNSKMYYGNRLALKDGG